MTTPARTHLILIACAVFLLPNIVSAAVLSFSFERNSVNVGDLVSGSVTVASADKTMNAASDTLTFDADLLQVVSVSKANSVLTLWVQEPSFSNVNGTVTFGGIVPDPGYTGPRGRILSVQFRAKKSGTASVRFSQSAQVLANDGNGTDILTSAVPGSISIVTPTVQPKATNISGISITSPTHPDQKGWYSATDATLRWKNSANATNIRIGYDKLEKGQPTVVYDTSVTEKSLKLSEGVWYFHVQEQTASGWGAVSTFRIQIDTTPPRSITLQFPDGSTFNNTQPVARFKTSDDLSGVSHYILSLENSSPLKIAANAVGDEPYTLPVLRPGSNSIKVTAYDYAGNSVSAQANFTVIGLNPPVINRIDDITSGRKLEITGNTYPNVQVELSLKNAQGQTSSQISQSDLSGAFRIIWKEILPVGVYTLAGQVTDSTSAKSTMSPEVTFQVTRSVLGTIVTFILDYLSIGILLILLILALLFAVRYAWHHLHALHIRLRRKINSEKLDHTHTVLHQEFEELRGAIEEELEFLQEIKAKRDLTLEEKRFVIRFQKMLDKTEAVLQNEIDSVAK